MKKIKIYSPIIFIWLTLLICNTAYADNFFDKGRNYTTYLGGTNINIETCVVSASANVTNKGSSLSGNEQIRVWGRLFLQVV